MGIVDVSNWLRAMRQDMESLDKNDTWSIIESSQEQQDSGMEVVFKNKERLSSESHPIYKARVITKGYFQVEGIDFHGVFSPVVKHSSIRALLALMAMEDMELHKLDVKMTLLYGKLDEEIYMNH